jgi:hypothetical protein
VQTIYKKYDWILIIASLIIWIIATPSHFQKGGVDSDFYFVIALFVCFISILITLLFDKFKIAERILISIPLASISLFLTTILVVPVFVDMIYSDKTWFFWETKHRLFINVLYYGLNAIILTVLATIYFQIRRSTTQRGKLIDSSD